MHRTGFRRALRSLQIANDFAQVISQINVLIIGIVSETLIGSADGIHPDSRLRSEETERREGEDWNVAKDYVRLLQNVVADQFLGCC